MTYWGKKLKNQDLEDESLNTSTYHSEAMNKIIVFK